MRCSDEVVVSLSPTIVEELGLLKDMTGGIIDAGIVLPISSVSSKHLNTIIEYAKHRNNHPDQHSEISSIPLIQEVSTWEREFFVGYSPSYLTQLLGSILYLQYSDMQAVLSKYLGLLIQGKNQEESITILTS